MYFGTIALPTAAADSQTENGRLQICKIGSRSAGQDEIEIPADGKYLIAGDKAGLTEPVVINQTEFLTNMGETSQIKLNGVLNDRFKLEDRDGKLIVHLTLKGSPCVYLRARAPKLDSSDLTLSGAYVAPNWIPGASGNNIGGVSYRYFNSVDQTYYVVSEVGKTLDFIVHFEETTGLGDHRKKIPVNNPAVLNLVSYNLMLSLKQLNQYDTNLVDLSKFNIKPADFDLNSSGDLSTLVAQFTQTVRPLPHSRLILALPTSGLAHIKFTNTESTGKRAEGLGFFRDGNTHPIYSDGPENIMPVAAFLNFQIAVIDLDSSKLLAIQPYSGSRTFVSSPFPEADLTQNSVQFSVLSGLANESVVKAMSTIFGGK
jgi:hypothetical protein